MAGCRTDRLDRCIMHPEPGNQNDGHSPSIDLDFPMRQFRLKMILLLVSMLVSQSQAQFYFGRNKIQYNQFDWHILETDHFDIYYYPEMRELAEIGAAHAENVFADLKIRFNHTVSYRIPLIFYATHAHFQETNTTPTMIPEGLGGFFEFLKNRVVVPANGSLHQFKRVMTHELVHVFTRSKEQSILKQHGLKNHAGLPLWFMEGIAELWSEGWSSETEMFIRDAVLSGYHVPLRDLHHISGSFLMYKEGQSLLKFIQDTYGPEKLTQIIENIWLSRNFKEVLSCLTAQSPEELDKAWLYDLQKAIFPLLEHKEPIDRVAHLLTHKGINIKPAYYLQEGKPHVVFQSNRTGYTNIYIKSLDGHSPARVMIHGEKSADLEAMHLLNSNLDIWQDMLAFTSKSGEQDALYVFDLKTRQFKHKFLFDSLVSLYSPSWSPDGKSLVFTALDFSGKSDLYHYHLVTDSLERLTNDYYDDRDPEWSPDGHSLVFSSDRGPDGEQGFYHLFSFHYKSRSIHSLTHGSFNNKNPCWSADGRRLAFVSDRDGTFNIYLLHNTLSPPLASNSLQVLQLISKGETPLQATPLTHLTTSAFDPEWTDQGELLFTGFQNLSYQIYHLQNVLDIPLALGDQHRPEKVERTWTTERLTGLQQSKAVKYKNKFNLDIAQSQITQDPIFGTHGGMQLVVSDMLGDHQYFFLLNNTARSRDEILESFNIAVSRTDLSRRTNFALGAYHFGGRRYNRYDAWFWERRIGGFGALSYPFSKFERIEASLNVRSSDKEWYYTRDRRKALLVSCFASYIKDTSLWGPTGPFDGERINITLGITNDFKHSQVRFITSIVDYRRYFRLSQRTTHAIRLWSQINYGKESTPFAMGGSWDLRGYSFFSLWGRKLVLMSNELRFPFIDRVSIRFPFGGLGLSSIRGALFTDLGNTWNEKWDHLLGSSGFGIRFRFGAMLVLRLDIGKKFEISKQPNLANDWFTQIFFGWDF